MITRENVYHDFNKFLKNAKNKKTEVQTCLSILILVEQL